MVNCPTFPANIYAIFIPVARKRHLGRWIHALQTIIRERRKRGNLGGKCQKFNNQLLSTGGCLIEERDVLPILILISLTSLSE